MNLETQQFIIEKCDVDIYQLALQSARYPLVDMALAIQQIHGKQKIKAKIPAFFQHPDILYPVQLSLEQSSSESTAKYKSTLCEGNSLSDLTGGFGIDSYFFSEHINQVTYIERDTELSEIANHNFGVLGRKNIKVINSDSTDYLKNMSRVDWIYLDPARRSQNGKKVVLLSDCEPNVTAILPLLLEKATSILIKLSPMIDITAALRELPTTSEIHIISIDNECKEVLILMNHLTDNRKKIKAINLKKDKKDEFLEFYWEDETNAIATLTSTVEKYLYEPNASIMKSAAFKYISQKFNIRKLHTNTHLYTSSELLIEFPGRIFEVLKTWDNSKAGHKELAFTNSKANITTRNYPLQVEELRKKLRIKDGGDVYLFACTLANQQKVIIQCKKKCL